MARSIDQIEHIAFAIGSCVVHPGSLELDRDAPLSFQIHVVEKLLLHISTSHRASVLQQPVSQSRLAVIDMGNDAEVPQARNGNVGHALANSPLGRFGVRIKILRILLI